MLSDENCENESVVKVEIDEQSTPCSYSEVENQLMCLENIIDVNLEDREDQSTIDTGLEKSHCSSTERLRLHRVRKKKLAKSLYLKKGNVHLPTAQHILSVFKEKKKKYAENLRQKVDAKLISNNERISKLKRKKGKQVAATVLLDESTDTDEECNAVEQQPKIRVRDFGLIQNLGPLTSEKSGQPVPEVNVGAPSFDQNGVFIKHQQPMHDKVDNSALSRATDLQVKIVATEKSAVENPSNTVHPNNIIYKFIMPGNMPIPQFISSSGAQLNISNIVPANGNMEINNGLNKFVVNGLSNQSPGPSNHSNISPANNVPKQVVYTSEPSKSTLAPVVYESTPIIVEESVDNADGTKRNGTIRRILMPVAFPAITSSFSLAGSLDDIPSAPASNQTSPQKVVDHSATTTNGLKKQTLHMRLEGKQSASLSKSFVSILPKGPTIQPNIRLLPNNNRIIFDESSKQHQSTAPLGVPIVTSVHQSNSVTTSKPSYTTGNIVLQQSNNEQRSNFPFAMPFTTLVQQSNVVTSDNTALQQPTFLNEKTGYLTNSNTEQCWCNYCGRLEDRMEMWENPRTQNRCCVFCIQAKTSRDCSKSKLFKDLITSIKSLRAMNRRTRRQKDELLHRTSLLVQNESVQSNKEAKE